MKDNGWGGKDSDWVLKKFYMGLRHQRIFRISDIQGQMVDAVISMRGKGPVPANCFLQIQRNDFLTVKLTDNEESISLTINSDGLIVMVNLDEDNPITVEQVEEIFSAIATVVVPMTEAKDKITRLGIVHEYERQGFENSAKTMFSDYLKFDLKGVPDSLHLRFALKNPTERALISLGKKGDYKNVIFTLSSRREKEDLEEAVKEEVEAKEQNPPTVVTASIDYQLYYVPQVSLKNVNIKGHLSESKTYIEKLKETGAVLRQ